MKKIDVVVNYWKSEAAKDLEKILDNFSEDASFTSPTMKLEGRDQIRRFYEGMVNGYRSIVVTPTHWIESGDEIAVEYDTDMLTREGEKRFARGFNLFRINAENRISLLKCYFNPNDF